MQLPPTPRLWHISSAEQELRPLGLRGSVPNFGEKQPVGTVCAPVIQPRLSLLSKCSCSSCLYPTFSTTCSSYSYPSCLYSESCFTFLFPLLRASAELLLCVFFQLLLPLFPVLWIWMCCFFPSPFTFQALWREQIRLLAAFSACALWQRPEDKKLLWFCSRHS